MEEHWWQLPMPRLGFGAGVPDENERRDLHNAGKPDGGRNRRDLVVVYLGLQPDGSSVDAERSESGHQAALDQELPQSIEIAGQYGIILGAVLSGRRITGGCRHYFLGWNDSDPRSGCGGNHGSLEAGLVEAAGGPQVQ